MDVELGKSGKEVFRVAREEVSMDAVKCVLDQKGSVSVLKEVFVMPDERSIGFRVRAGSLSTSTQLNYERTHTFSLRLGGMNVSWTPGDLSGVPESMERTEKRMRPCLREQARRRVRRLPKKLLEKPCPI